MTAQASATFVRPAPVAPKTVRGKAVIKNISVVIRQYPLSTSDSMPKRLADCLYWSAKECPKQVIPLHILATVVNGFSRTCSTNAAEVTQMRRRWGHVRKLLLRDYGSDLVLVRGAGVRASVGSEDIAAQTLKPKMRRYENARLSVEATLMNVNAADIKEPVLKNWVLGMLPAFKQLSSPDLINKLLPPAPVTPKKAAPKKKTSKK